MSTPHTSSGRVFGTVRRLPAIAACTSCAAFVRIAPISPSSPCGTHSTQSGASPERIMRKPATTRKTATSSSSSNPSSSTTTSSPERSLDPADARGWEQLRVLGHRMVDDMLEYLRTARARGRCGVPCRPTCAREGFDVRERGLQNGDAPQLTIYASTETHSSVRKAIELLGLGHEALRRIPVRDDYTINLAALRQILAADRAAGRRPICIVGNAGTVNTGATDDLQALAAICRDEHLWFHVDGAFGALAALAPPLRHLVAGLEQADSVAFDLHKWMYLPYEVGCTLVRDQTAHRATFTVTPAYLASFDRGIAAGGFPFAERGVQLSRGFRALKVWMSFKTYGLNAFAQLIEQNVRQAHYLAGLVTKHPRLELVAPAPLNVVCFRFTVTGATDERLNEINKEILLRIQESGLAIPSHTKLDGKFAIRVAVTNHRSRREDFDLLVRAVVETGTALR